MCTSKSLYFFKIGRTYNYLEFIYTLYYVYNVDGYFGHIIEVPCQMLFECQDRRDPLLCFVCIIYVNHIARKSGNLWCSYVCCINLLGVTYEVVHFQACDTLIGSIGNKVAASHAVVAGSIFPLRLHWLILCARRSGGTAHEGGGASSQLNLTFLTPMPIAGCAEILASIRSSPVYVV